MWELAGGLVVMLGLFAVLLGGMIIVTRADKSDLDHVDAVRSPLPGELTVVGRASPPAGAVTAPPLSANRSRL